MSDFSQKSVKIIQNEPNWQKEMANGVSDIDTLYRLLELSKPTDEADYRPEKFPLRVPMAFVAKMKKGDPNDPLLLQVLPTFQEQIYTAGYHSDPLDENNHNPITGLIHKYQSRALITTTGACAIHCRYCFRQHFDYQANLSNNDEIKHIVEYLNADDKIDEVVLSGGDPLNLNNRRLGTWFDAISTACHVKTIRIHTRLPVVLPNRVDGSLLELLSQAPQKIVMVLHINHPNEIDDVLAKKCQLLQQAGAVLLNQSVLLRSVNDDVEVLARLSEKLFDIGVMPYYLHVLDKVAGAAHFDLPESQAVAIYWGLLERLAGYLVPKLVREVPNRPHKMPINIHQYAPKSW